VQPHLPIYHKSLKDTIYSLYVRWADARVCERCSMEGMSNNILHECLDE
jgi:hypothetical protein